MVPSGRSDRIARLRDAIAKIEDGRGPAEAGVPPSRPKVALGGDASCRLDGPLGGGLERGGLHEVVAAHPGDMGAASGFALALAIRFGSAGGGALLWVSEDFAGCETGALYGPGLAAHGLDPERLVLVQAAKPDEALWAMEEAVRVRALAAVVGELWTGKLYDLAASRRLLLAARGSGTPCLLLHAGAAGQADGLSSAADTRFVVKSHASAGERPADGAPLPGLPAWSARLAKARAGTGLDRDHWFDCVWDPAERCMRDGFVSILPSSVGPLPVGRPAVPADRPPAPPDAGVRRKRA